MRVAGRGARTLILFAAAFGSAVLVPGPPLQAQVSKGVGASGVGRGVEGLAGDEPDRPDRPRIAEPDEDDLRETIALLFMVRMKNELGLTKPQYEQILPKVDERERKKKAAFEDHRVHFARLRDLIARKNASDSEIEEEVDRILVLDDTERRMEDAFIADVRKLLSPRQQAKFLLFRQRFRAWLDNRMRDAQELRRPVLRRRPGLGPGLRRPDRAPEGPPGDE